MEWIDTRTGERRRLLPRAQQQHIDRRIEYWSQNNRRRDTYMMRLMRNEMRNHRGNASVYNIFRGYMNNPQMLQWRRNRRYAEEDRERFGANNMGMHRYYGPGYYQPY